MGEKAFLEAGMFRTLGMSNTGTFIWTEDNKCKQATPLHAQRYRSLIAQEQGPLPSTDSELAPSSSAKHRGSTKGRNMNRTIVIRLLGISIVRPGHLRKKYHGSI